MKRELGGLKGRRGEWENRSARVVVAICLGKLREECGFDDVDN